MLEAGLGLAAGLLALEVTSRVFAWKWLRRGSPAFRFSRYGVPLFLAYALTVGVSFSELALHQHVTPARVTVGTAIFLAGWLTRYSVMTQWWSMRSLAPASRYAWSERLYRLMPVRHAGYVGAILEAAGVACILSSVAGAAAALLILPSAALASAYWPVRRAMTYHRARGRDYSPPDVPAIGIPWQTAAVLLVPLALVYLFAAFLTREVEIFTSGTETGRTLMLSLAGAQGTLGILALTLVVVLIQMTTAAYSGVLARTVWFDRLAALALAFLLGSIVFDVVVVARSDSWLAGDMARAGALVDSGLFLAALAMVCVLLSALASVRMVAPERLMLRVLQGLDASRIVWAAAEWPSPFGPRRLDPTDPMRSVQALLRELISKRDLQSLRFGLAQLREQLEKYRHVADAVSVHGYCHYYLGPLVDAAASETGAEGLEEFLNFVYFLRLPSPEWIKEVRLGGDVDGPPGELLLRKVIDAAIANNQGIIAGRGLHLIAEQVQKVLPLLPRQEDTMWYNPSHDFSIQLTDEERHRLQDNGAKISLVRDRYIGYFQSVAERALKVPCDLAAWYASGNLSRLVTEICRGVDSPRVRERLMGRALHGLGAVAAAVCEAARPEGLNMMGLDSAMDALDAEDPEQAEAIDAIAAITGRIARKLGHEGLLRYGTVSEVAMVGIYAGEKRPQAARILVEAMGHALQDMPTTPGFDRNDEAQFAVKELRERIQQVAWRTRGEGAEEVQQAAKQFLKAGDESKAH